MRLPQPKILLKLRILFFNNIKLTFCSKIYISSSENVIYNYYLTSEVRVGQDRSLPC